MRVPPLVAAFALCLSTTLFAHGIGLTVDAAGAQAAVAVDAPPVYTLGTGDQLRITVFGEEKLTGQYYVGSDGSVSLPLIGSIPASGKTVAQLQDEIAEALSHGYIVNPRVSAEVLNYRPFFILGEVNKPAQYPYIEQLTVAQAVALAGGYTYRANERAAFIRHKGQAKEVRFAVDKNSAVWVLPGDTVRIGQRYF